MISQNLLTTSEDKKPSSNYINLYKLKISLIRCLQ
jgi:hypothetical protein